VFSFCSLKVESNGVYRTLLLQCKGKRSVRCMEKEASNKSLNTGDCFVLDLSLQLFLWNGKEANKYKKAQGVEMIKKVHDERGVKGTITVVDGDDANNATFWEALGGKIEVTGTGESDEKAAVALADIIQLHHISDDATGSVTMDEVAHNDKGQSTRDMLDTKVCGCLID
jgi:hypothetical protein